MVCWTTPQRVADPVAMRVAVDPLPQLRGPRWLSNHEGGDHSGKVAPGKCQRSGWPAVF